MEIRVRAETKVLAEIRVRVEIVDFADGKATRVRVEIRVRAGIKDFAEAEGTKVLAEGAVSVD